MYKLTIEMFDHIFACTIIKAEQKNIFNFFELWKQKAVVGKEVYFCRVKDVNNSHLSLNKLLLGTTSFAPQKYTLLE